MPEIDVFDGHCDTVLMCHLKGGGFGRNGYHVDLERAGKYRRYAQFFALFGQPEDFPGLSFEEIFRKEYALFAREMEQNAAVITHCRTAQEAEDAFAAVRGTIETFVEGGVTEEEFLRGREQVKSGAIFSQENTSSQMLLYGKEMLYNRKVYDFERRMAEIAALRREDILRAIAQNFDFSRAAVASVGNLGGGLKL